MNDSNFSKNSMIKYLQEVLGVKQVLRELETQQSETKEIYIWIENFQNFSNQDFDLLEKMIAATKIERSVFKILNLSAEKDFKESAFINSRQIHFQMLSEPVDLLSQTYSPQVLHQSKELKSKAWTFLQQVMNQYHEL